MSIAGWDSGWWVQWLGYRPPARLSTRGSPRAVVTRCTSSGPHTLPWRLPLTLACTDWPAPVVVPSPPQQRPGRRFGIHRQRGMSTYSIGLCLTPWTSHTVSVHYNTSRAAQAYSPHKVLCVRCHCVGYIYIASCCRRDVTPPILTAVRPHRQTAAMAYYRGCLPPR